MYVVKLGSAYISDVDWCQINKDEVVIKSIHVSVDGTSRYMFNDRRFANKVRQYCKGEMIKIYRKSRG